MTNLSVPANLIYPLYRLRWQIELIFKSCKSTLSLSEVPTNNPNIVMNLLLSSIISYISSLTILQVAKEELSSKEITAITPQRISKIFFHLNFDFIQFLIFKSKKYLDQLKKKIILYAHELFDPLFKSRPTSLQ